MVNSGSFDSDGQGDRNAKVGFTQPHNAPDGTQSSSPVTASAATPCKTDFSQTADSDLPSVAHAIEPTPTKTEFNSDMPVENFTNLSSVDGLVEESVKPPATSPSSGDEKTSLCCSLPLDKVQGVLTPYHPPATTKADDEGTRTKQPARKLLCLYCDRSFVSANLRQKHVERIHSVRQNRRVSSRRQNQLTVTPCVYCDKLNGTENTLKDLFQHLINEHSSKYFGCLPCEDRFLTSTLLTDHNASKHPTRSRSDRAPESLPVDKKTAVKTPPPDVDGKAESEEDEDEEIPVKITRSKMRSKPEEECKKAMIGKKKSTKLKELRAKKLSVKSSRIALKRRESKRLQAIAKIAEAQKKKRPKPTERKQSNLTKTEQANSTKSTEKSKSNSTCVNPYPEFDHFYRVKKITDHSIDNLKISSLTFDDVFDKAFFNRIKCNIEENLLHHIDGKLFENEESESRISNFEKVSNVPQEVQNTNSENYGCELSLNAVTPVASLSLNSQFGEDFESQIEYGSKPSKKKTQTRKDEVHYKYFTRRKYQASILEHKENRDLSKLDMWTQLVIKKRQQKMLDDKKSAKEILEYTTCDEYKNKLRREELNRILDRRGPFEDLKEEASKKAALDKLNLASEDSISQESFTEVREVLNEILNRVFAATDDIRTEIETVQANDTVNDGKKPDLREIPGYLNLRRSSSLPSDGEIDKSDRIALICSSQETENFELPTNQVRGKNELIELTGEWARCRMYICAACGAKLPNMKFLLEHKSLYHQNVWVQHYEFVGNQSELYRHLSIPALGKVGAVEKSVQCKLWRRSDARVCTKCGKQCNALGELHRHILECGGDWTWMLARKKVKYRPFGAKSRRKRRGLVHRIHHKQKTEPTEKKTYKKRFDGPRQRPSDADTIQRMLANLPAKRSTRKLISLHDGIYRARKKTQINNINQKKVKCGKVIYKTTGRKETTEKTINTATTVTKSQKNNLSSSRRSLRTLNKVLASRILDTNSKLTVKRKLKALTDKRNTKQSEQEQEESKEPNDERLGEPSSTASAKLKPKSCKKDSKATAEAETAPKRTSPRSSPQNVKKKMTVKKLLTGNISIKSFFPVKKRKQKNNAVENQDLQDAVSETENIDIKTRSKRKSKEICEAEEEKKDEVVNVKIETKKTKNETFGNLVRSLSFHKKNAKTSTQNNSIQATTNNKVIKKQSTHKEKLVTVEEEKEADQEKSTKKRKLKRSFRNVINKVKKLKIENTPVNTAKVEVLPQKPNARSAFLEETKQDGSESPAQAEKIVIPSTLEAKENLADISTPAPIVMNFHDPNENPPIPETIFKLESNNEKNLQAKGELDFDNQPVQATNASNQNSLSKSNSKTDLTAEENKETTLTENNTAIENTDKTQPITIETSVKPKVVPLISPNMKGKIRKPTRGLNDCIAMLTSKLQQKTVEETTAKVDSIFNLLSPNNITKTSIEAVPPKPECILRIPTFKTQKVYPEIEETALDLSTKTLNKQGLSESQKSFTGFQETSKIETSQSNAGIKTSQILQANRIFNSVDQIIEEVVENRIQKSILSIPVNTWTSVDETIQNVIDNKNYLQYKIPTRNTIDEIIDFVVGYGDPNYPLTEIKTVTEVNSVSNKTVKKPGRKIGSIRKTTNKKSASEIKPNISVETINPLVVASGIKEQLSVIPFISAASENVVIADLDLQNSDVDIKRSGSSKKKNSKKVVRCESAVDTNAKQNIVEKVISVQNTSLNIHIDDLSKSVENKDNVEKVDNTGLIFNQTENDIQQLKTSDTDLEVKIDSVLNKAFINPPDIVNGKTGSLKNTKGVRKVGQIRSKSRSKKEVEITKKISEKPLLETNLDTLSDVQEVSANILPTNEFIDNEATMTKHEELKQLLNEDEPVLLENKVVTHQQKPNVLHSDSEDDIPLAALMKPEDSMKITDKDETKEGTPLITEKVGYSESENGNQNITLNVEDYMSDNILELKNAIEKMTKWNSKSPENADEVAQPLQDVQVLPTDEMVLDKDVLTEDDQSTSKNNLEEKCTDETVIKRNSKSSKDIAAVEPDIDIAKVSVKETMQANKTGKKTQKKKSKSVKKKVVTNLSQPDILNEKTDLDLTEDSPDSDTPLNEILKKKDCDVLYKIETACVDDSSKINSNSCEKQSDEKPEDRSELDQYPNASLNVVLTNTNFTEKSQKKKPKSVKSKAEINEKEINDKLTKIKTNTLAEIGTETNSLAKELNENSTEQIPKPKMTNDKNESLIDEKSCEKLDSLGENTEILDLHSIASTSDSLDEKMNPEMDSSPVKEKNEVDSKQAHIFGNHEPNTSLKNDVKLDTSLKTLSTSKETEADIEKTTVTDVDADSDTPLTMIITNKVQDKTRKRKSRSGKRKTEIDSSTLKECEPKLTNIKKNTKLIKDISKCNSAEDTILKVASDDLLIESDVESKKLNTAISKCPSYQFSENNKKEINVEKTEISFPDPAVTNTPKRSSLKKDGKMSTDPGLTMNQIHDNLIISLDATTIEESIKNIDSFLKKPVDVSKPTKRRSRSLKNKKMEVDINQESSNSSLGDLPNEVVPDKIKIPNSMEAQPIFAEPKIKPSRRRSKSVKSNMLADDFSSDSVLSDSSFNSSELLDDSRDKLIEAPSLSETEKISNSQEPQFSLLENKDTSIDCSISLNHNSDTLENTQLLQLKPKSKKNMKNSRSLKNKSFRKNSSLNKNKTSFKDQQQVPDVKDEIIQSKTEGFEGPEVTDNVVDVFKLNISLHTSIANGLILGEEIGDKIDLLESEIVTKRRSARSIKKKPVVDCIDQGIVDSNNSSETNDENLEIPEPIPTFLVTSSEFKKADKKRSRSLKNRTSNNNTDPVAVITDAINGFVNVNENPSVDLKAKNKKRTKGRSKSLTNTVDDSVVDNDVSKKSNTELEDTSTHFVNLEPKPKRRLSLRNSHKEKNKGVTTDSKQDDTEELPSVNTPQNITNTTNNISECITSNDMSESERVPPVQIETPTDKILETPSQVVVENGIDENISANQKSDQLLDTSNYSFQEPPIKIIINKQKTRRKSKSFKKVDLKGQNDLFEDFALVIKKPKRIAPIITYTPVDNFAKDIYPKYIKQPVEQIALSAPLPLPPPPTLSPPLLTSKPAPQEVTEETPEDLDASVEEMDMELDEIPIISNIIERDSSSFTCTPPTTNIFAKENIDVDETFPTTSKINEKEHSMKRNRNKSKNSKYSPKEELTQIFDKDLPLTTKPIDELIKCSLPSDANIPLTMATTICENITDISDEVFQSPEKNLLLNEEFLYETNRRSTRNKNIAVVSPSNSDEVKTPHKKSKTKPKNKSRLDESSEITEDIKIDFVCVKLNDELNKNNHKLDSTILSNASKETQNCLTSTIDFISSEKEETIVKESVISNDNTNKLEANLIVALEKEIEVDFQKSNIFLPLNSNLHHIIESKTKKNKRKKSKSGNFENEPVEEPISLNPSSTPLNTESLNNKEKDIDNIYTFTELEDLEIEKPIEIPRRLAKKQPKLNLEMIEQHSDNIKQTKSNDSSNISTVSTIENKESGTVVEEPTPKSVARKRSRSGKDIFHVSIGGKEESTGEIKENNVDIELQENGRRKSVRSAKVKALEHIHDDALAELTESERNRDLNRAKALPSEGSVPVLDELTKKKVNRRQSRAQKVQKVVENTELPKENAGKLPDDLNTLENTIQTGLEKEHIYPLQEELKTLDDITSKKCNKKQSKDEQALESLDDVEKSLVIDDLENLDDVIEKKINDALASYNQDSVSPNANKKKGNKRQSKSQKVKKPVDRHSIVQEIENTTVNSDLEKELKENEAELSKEKLSPDEIESLLDESPIKNINKKDKSQKIRNSIEIPELLESSEKSTFAMSCLEELEKPIETKLDEDKLSKETVICEEFNKIFTKKPSQRKNQKLLDTFETPTEIVQKCTELIDFADNIVGLEELENSIERELNTELEVKQTTKQSKAKALPKLMEDQNEPNEDENIKSDFLIEENFQELRRSRRGSRKITSYNENDLVDPLLDEIDNKRKSRKKERADENIPESRPNKKPKETEKKLNSDELFDLLKASTNENKSTPKESNNSFLNNLDEVSSKEFDDNFDNVFENILEKSFLIQNTLSDKDKEEKDIDKIYEFTESPESTEQINVDLKPLEAGRKTNKKLPRRNISPAKQTEENSESTLNATVSDTTFSIPNTPDLQDSSVDSRHKSSKVDKTDLSNKSNYCEICNKSFIRIENLVKHKRTLTHIQKLSEIEAKEAAEKSKSEDTQNEPKEPFPVEITAALSKTTSDTSKNDINISDILQDSSKPNGQQSPMVHSSFTNNHSLKLADIINDVLNKPVLEGDNEKHNSFSDIIMQNNAETQPEYRRYKSLGERKSFDSEPIEPQPLPIAESYISKTTILEKQISLLENIIENQTGVNYIDDISMSSNNSVENNPSTRESPSELSLKQDDSSNIPYMRNNLLKPTSNDESFLKPSQYEEISEDSINMRNYDDQKLRKTLNRDEELFLECCSLLKSGSEVSSYSNKKSHSKILSNMGLKQCDEPEWLERKSLVQKPMYDVANDYSDDNSRIPTPLGDSYDDDASNSNTISSNWNMNKKTPAFVDKKDDANKTFSFEEVLHEYVDHDKESNINSISKFEGILKTNGQTTENCNTEPIVIDLYEEEPSEKKQDEFSDGSTSDGKKIITKGARKVFEGLKVSIPTEELNLEEVLNCSPKQKKMETQNSTEDARSNEEPASPPAKPSRTARKSKPVKNKSQVGSNLLFKMNKKKMPSPTNTKKKDDEVKPHDIYDFEETQDNTDVFTKPDFRTFRNMKSNEPIPEPESDTESRDYLDPFSVEARSATSSISSSSWKKPKTQENITKKKCMIMGRIFKNQAKSKLEDIDEEMRNIPEIDNSELVESYVADCKKIIRNEDIAKPKLSEKEINLLFDQLLESRFDNKDPVTTETKTTSKPKPEAKKTDNKKKLKPKNKKRTRTNSDSTDDEFNINKVTKKRAYRKNGKAEDNCINLEQELKECIGVASRKSQRKCTSGKQNVLVEYWSSDDSQFEALLESQRIEAKICSKTIEENHPEEVDPIPQISEVSVEEIMVEAPLLASEVLEKPHKPKSTEKKPPQKRKFSSDKKPKSGGGVCKNLDTVTSNRRKRAAANPLYHWSSSSEDESQDLIEVKPIRDELEDDEDRPVQHGWIVGDSPKKLVTMLAQAKGKKTDIDCVKEQGKKRTNAVS